MWLLKGRKRKRQRGVFLPLLGTLAKRLLESAVRTVGSKLLEKLYKNLWTLEVEKDREKPIDDEEKE